MSSAATSPAITLGTSTTQTSTSPTSSSTTSSSTTQSSTTSQSQSTTTSSSTTTQSGTTTESGTTSAQSTSAVSSSDASGTGSSAQSASQSASSAIVPTSITTTDSIGSTITTSGTVTVPASQVTGGRTSFMTVTVTDSSGNAQESVIQSVAPSSGSKTNIGAIVGGTVGGVVGLLAILALLWFCVFKKRRNHKGEFDDMMFDPGRSRHAAPGQTDILDDEANNNDVEPYTYGQNVNATGVPQMSQYNAGYPASSGGGIAPGLPPLSTMGASTAVAAAAPLTSRGSYSEASQSGGANIARGPSTASTLTSAGFAGRGAQPQSGQMPFSQFYQQANGSAPGMPVAVPTGQQQQQQQPPMSAAAQRKAREAAQERQALRAANPSDGYYPQTPHQSSVGGGAAGGGGAPSPGASQSSGPVSPGASGASGVLVHEDMRRYIPGEGDDDVVEGPSELPPQYHSIRRE